MTRVLRTDAQSELLAVFRNGHDRRPFANFDVDEIEFIRCVQRELPFAVEIVSQHNADELFPVVSAASILAKVCRDREMRGIERTFGVPIGSGYASDPDTISFLERWIRETGALPPHTRASWDTARRLLAESRIRKLDEFGGD